MHNTKKNALHTENMKADPSVKISHRKKNWNWVPEIGKKLVNGQKKGEREL